MNSYPTRRMSVGFTWLGGAILLCGFGSLGCGKVEEMAKTATESAKEAVAASTSKSAPSPAPAPTPDATEPPANSRPAPKVDSDKLLQEFLATPSREIGDEHVLRLASMDAAHKEQVLKLDLTGSAIQDAGIRALASFPNLAEIKLGGTSVLTTAGLERIKDCLNLQSLSLADSNPANDSTCVALAEMPRLEHLYLKSVPITKAGLKSLAQSKSLKYLDLSECVTLSGPDLAVLTEMPALTGLNLARNQNMDNLPQGLVEVTRCKNLRELEITSCGLIDVHFTIFKTWPNLTALRCGGNGLTDQGMLFLKPLNDLVELNLSGTKIGDAGISQISSRKLERLWLSGISDQGMTLIKRFPALRELYVGNTGISDQGIVQLKSLKNLEVLDISRTTVSDRGLAELTGIKSLKRINAVESGISEAGKQAMQQAIPGLVFVNNTSE